jgi:hypothetical protein
MTTSPNDPHTRRIRRGPSVLVLLGVLGSALLLSFPGAHTGSPRSSREALQAGGIEADELDGRDPRQMDSKRPKVEASFPSESYGPGSKAPLIFVSRAKSVTLQFFRAGTEDKRPKASDVMFGSSVSPRSRIGKVWPHRTVRVRIGNWPSGVYFARLRARGGRIGYAPFVLRPRHLGEHRVAVVLPTQTWQAYNFRDENGDHLGDTWYADWNRHTVRLGRAFLNRGVPPHYKYYDEPFLRWLQATGKAVDYLSDAELNHASGRELARDYALIVFPGHHEYVTRHEYDAVTEFRNRGGNLMFLAANVFFCRIDIRGDVMHRVDPWRELGRPEAQLVGVQYIGWNQMKYGSKPYVLQSPPSAAWIFEGTGLQNGDKFTAAGVEIDARASSSPRGTKVLATIPNVFGPGKTAEMTYYETASGAKVFAAGAFSLGASVRNPRVAQIVQNLWTRLAQP